MKIKRILSLIFLSLLISTFIIGCEIEDENTGKIEDENKSIEAYIDNTPVYGGEIALPLTKFDTLNPLITENNNYYFFSKLMFEGLFEFDNELNVVNQLAKEYSILEDGKTIEIHLKDNIFWHDGKPFTAEDVEFTIETIKLASGDSIYKKMLNSAMGFDRPFDIRRLMDIRLLDEHKISISFDRAFANNLEVLTFPIIPKHIYTTGRATNRDYANALALDNYLPIGTGPYKFESYDKMKRIVLSSNENYRENKPYIDKITGIVLESEESIVTAFETGQINIGLTAEADWDKYQMNDRIKILEFISRNYEFLGFNFSNEIFQGENGKSLRKAIAYGIDRQLIIEKLYLGHGTQVDVPIHPNSFLLSEKANTYGYNLEQAKSELEKLGLEDLSLTILTNTYNPDRLKIAELIREDLEKLGLKINIVPEINQNKRPTDEEIEEQWEEINAILAKGQFDMVVLGWELSTIPDLTFAFHSSQIPYNTNFIRYNNGGMDSLLETIFLNGNRNSKSKQYEELQGLIIEELPYYSLFFKNNALLVDSKIVGELQPTFFNIYNGIEKAFIPKELQ